MSGVKIHIYEGTAKEFYIFMREYVKCHSNIESTSKCKIKNKL